MDEIQKPDQVQNFIQIDEEGYGLFGEIRVTDEKVGQEILDHLSINETWAVESVLQNQKVLVEAFDEPLVVQQVDVKNGEWTAQGPYQFFTSFSLENLTLDEWDRFHGVTDKGLPFVFSRKAQAHFFNLLEEYTDDSISFDGETYEIPAHLSENPAVNKENWWSDVYREEALKEMLPRMKMPKSRILVLGCGEGHDAALFAGEGHKVTAVDFSTEAIRRGQEKYGHLSNLTFLERDLFKLGSEFDQSFDVIFEHTCYCAIDPTRRNELVKVWNRCLAEKGFLMGIFFTMEKRQGPPYGASEWEIRERLKKYYQFLFWGRWRQSLPRRQGKELFVYAQKRT
jgi:SAM-dependent methyltransferase